MQSDIVTSIWTIFQKFYCKTVFFQHSLYLRMMDTLLEIAEDGHLDLAKGLSKEIMYEAGKKPVWAGNGGDCFRRKFSKEYDRFFQKTGCHSGLWKPYETAE